MLEYVGLYIAVVVGAVVVVVSIVYFGMAIEWAWNWLEDRYG